MKRRPIGFELAFLYVAVFLSVACPASAQHGILTVNASGDPTTHFAVGEMIFIEGVVDCVSSMDYPCETALVPDQCMFVQTGAADIYLIPDDKLLYECYPIGSNYIHTVSVFFNGFPPHVFGPMALGAVQEAGCYDIIIDENQNGVFGAAYDFWLGNGVTAAVVIGDNPDCDIDTAQRQLLKDWADASYYAVRNVFTWAGVFSFPPNVTGFGGDYYGTYVRCLDEGETPEACERIYASMIQEAFALTLTAGSPLLGIGPQLVFCGPQSILLPALQHALTAQYDMLRNDPPDPNYEEPASPTGYAVGSPAFGDSLEVLLTDLANLTSLDLAHVGAILSSFEKYQGAHEEEDLDYKLLHLRNTIRYASWVVASSSHADQLMDRLEQYVLDHDVEQFPDYSLLLDLQDRISLEGLTLEERQSMLRVGASEAQIDSLTSRFVREDYESVSAAGILSAIDEYRAARVNNTDLQEFVDAASGVLARYEDEGFLNDLPTADAGGPYAGGEGSPIELTGSGSSPNGPLSFAWDTDGDGEFDDITLQSGSVVYDTDGDHLAVLKVTDATGRSDVSVAQVSVTNVYDPPNIVSFSPEHLQPARFRGATVRFETTTTDPTEYQWYLGSEAVSTAGFLDVHTDSVAAGPHGIRVTMTNPAHPSASVTLDWDLMVVALEVSPDSIGTVLVGDGGVELPLWLRNAADDTASVTIVVRDSTAAPVEWATATPDTLDLPPGSDASVLLVLSCAGMAPGLYGGFVDIQLGDYYGSHGPMPLAMDAQCSLEQWACCVGDSCAMLTELACAEAGGEWLVGVPSCDPDPCGSPTNLVAYWSFDEGTGNTAHDQTGNGNDGTIIGASWAEGLLGSALSFDGTDDCVIVSNHSSLNPSSLTVACWLKYAAEVPEWGSFAVSKMGSSDGGYGLGDGHYWGWGVPSSWGTHTFTLATPDSYFSVDSGTEAAPGAGWGFVAGTYDDSSGMARIYVNGSVRDSLHLPDAIVADPSSLAIGMHPLYTHWFHGWIDEVRIYSRALSPSELDSLLYQGAADVTEDSSQRRATVEIGQNRPNPFGPFTSFIVEATQPLQGARVRIHDLAGRLVREIELGDLRAGDHQVLWDGSTDAGERAGSGVYFYRVVHAEGRSATRKAIVLK